MTDAIRKPCPNTDDVLFKSNVLSGRCFYDPIKSFNKRIVDVISVDTILINPRSDNQLVL
jgi:hypothetical protein